MSFLHCFLFVLLNVVLNILAFSLFLLFWSILQSIYSLVLWFINICRFKDFHLILENEMSLLKFTDFLKNYFMGFLKTAIYDYLGSVQLVIMVCFRYLLLSLRRDYGSLKGLISGDTLWKFVSSHLSDLGCWCLPFQKFYAGCLLFLLNLCLQLPPPH